MTTNNKKIKINNIKKKMTCKSNKKKSLKTQLEI